MGIIRSKSRRWQKQMNDMHAEGWTMRKYDSFNVEPGMSAWVDMPDDYKKQFYKFQERRQNIEELERIEREKSVTIDRRVKQRIRNMEKKFFENKGSQKIEKKDRTRAPKKKFNNQTAAQVCNFIDRQFFSKRKDQIKENLTIKKERPKVVLIADVCGWAWWNKSQYLQAYLADDYDIDVICLIGPEQSGINARKYELYITYGYSYVLRLQNVPKNRRVTGMTAHRPLNILKGYMSYAANVHANSIMLMEDLKKIFTPHNRIYYVPNGVDEQIFTETTPIRKDGDLIAGHVGKKCPLKHQDDIILPALKETGLKSITNLSDYTNKRPYCEMAEIYNEMDVFVVASEEDGTPNPALEAASCGRPIISNRIGNMPEFIKDGYNGFLLDDMNVESYVEKLEYLKNNRDHLIEMGKNARKTVEEGWTWKIQSENYRKMFKSILGK
jgi:glycosyltransferase involved in cell wall biosynthesis